MGKAFYERQRFAMTGSAVPVVPAGIHVSYLSLDNPTNSYITFTGTAVGDANTDVQSWTVPANASFGVIENPYHDVLYPNGLQVTAAGGFVCVASGLSL